MSTAPLSFKEIRIHVPWGHIAAKEWGNANSQHHILAIPGWQDNAGTYDLLIPMLSSDLHIVAVDLPGHGLSSHRPPGVLYHLFDWVVDVHRVIEHLKWDKVSFMGHSMGLGISISYAACFPARVLKVVGLDQITALILPLEDLAARMAIGMGQTLISERAASRNPRPVSFDTAVGVLVDTLEGSMTKEAAAIQLRRGVTPAAETGKVTLNRDARLLVNPIPGIAFTQVKALAKSVRCEILVIAASRGTAFGNAAPEEVEELVGVYKRGAKLFEVVTVDGTHHVHLNNPAVVAPHINKFFK